MSEILQKTESAEKHKAKEIFYKKKQEIKKNLPIIKKIFSENGSELSIETANEKIIIPFNEKNEIHGNLSIEKNDKKMKIKFKNGKKS